MNFQRGTDIRTIAQAGNGSGPGKTLTCHDAASNETLLWSQAAGAGATSGIRYRSLK